MKPYKCIISVFLTIAITFSMVTPAFAVDPGTIIGAMEVAPDFGSWLWSGIKGSASFIGSFILTIFVREAVKILVLMPVILFPYIPR